jgi:hypothetical protein
MTTTARTTTTSSNLGRPLERLYQVLAHRRPPFARQLEIFTPIRPRPTLARPSTSTIHHHVEVRAQQLARRQDPPLRFFPADRRQLTGEPSRVTPPQGEEDTSNLVLTSLFSVGTKATRQVRSTS